jgi:lysylphosphatidylglycerol synthetase-like protein (DUF2156 family)
MAPSVLDDKAVVPDDEQLETAIGKSFKLWNDIRGHIFERYDKVVEKWTHSGKNYGWSWRAKQGKRALVYLIPQKGFFLAAFCFGDKAVVAVEESNVPEAIKEGLRTARKYAEGRGIRFEVRKAGDVKTIRTLLEIKTAK